MKNEKVKAPIHVFIPFAETAQVRETLKNLRKTNKIAQIYLLTLTPVEEKISGCEALRVPALTASIAIRTIAACSTAAYTLLYTQYATLEPGLFALERMAQIIEDSGAGMVYADHYQLTETGRKNAPVIDYQFGSLRDDFDFGSLLLFRTEALKEAAGRMKADYKYAGLYDLRLKLSQKESLVHINEYLYSEGETDTRQSGEKMFDYVDPKNREAQIEMEQACTEHLKEIGGYLLPSCKKVEFTGGDFEYEASVIIPVRNRIRTIEEAIRSALSQKTTFKFNLIIVDNHSTDGTTDAIRRYVFDKRLLHIIPERTDLGIGGCWNVGVCHPRCGKFVVQLDSDDVYSDENALQTLINAFYEQNCAMIVGTYMTTDFDRNRIPPGIIDHKEWTPENGHNNALRINGLGAPRAFYTPVLREKQLPDTSYGEDYAVGLIFSRCYPVGRVYDVVYHCRRWEGNSDTFLDTIKTNEHNFYKDKIRTWELQARIKNNMNVRFVS
ncbi:hypothetical protein EZS27_007941 [termite gut metagenome]|uniref:Glycosyltransferase 2-like domain-containing protein n=1 Tax=termite gut metagenome TaxID=433724 RepID=A0A5J4SE87_9ZZZZ